MEADAEGTPFGRYRLIELLGRGGMGEVWRAYDPINARYVALKVLPSHSADDQMFQERFRREARAAAGLDDPHVIPIYDSGEIDGRLFVSMRLVVGRDLQQLLNDGPLLPARGVSIIEQIAFALHAAHNIGLVHRDVKPSNILLADHDFAYLIDFGIARAAGETAITATGATIGTHAYMSPERFRSGTIGPSSDIYALACVLYQCLTGQPPFPGNTFEQIALAHIADPIPQTSAKSAVTAVMDRVIATGLAKDPADRYATTLELAAAAREALMTQLPTKTDGSAAEVTVAQEPDAPQHAQLAATAGVSPHWTSADLKTGQKPTRDSKHDSESLAVQAPKTADNDPTRHDQIPTYAGPSRLPATEDYPTGPGAVPDGTTFIPSRSMDRSGDLPSSRRLSRRAKLLSAGVAILLVVVAVGVIVIVNRLYRGGGGAAPRSTVVSSSASYVPPAPPVTDEAALQRLLAMAPADARCSRDYDMSPPAMAHAKCAPPALAGGTVHYVKYADRASLDNAFRSAITQSIETLSSCPGMGPSPQDWRRQAQPQQVEGKLACASENRTAGFGPSYPRVFWTMNSDLVLGELDGTFGDETTIYGWWAAHYL